MTWFDDFARHGAQIRKDLRLSQQLTIARASKLIGILSFIPVAKFELRLLINKIRL